MSRLPEKLSIPLVLAVIAVAIALGTLLGGAKQHRNLADSSTTGLASQTSRTPAPSLDGGIGWLNVARPLTLQDLHGKIVLLDFWTYGCINCMHIIPDLKRLEAKYGEKLAVIGVHSAKFANEKETENIRSVILRYDLEHPVINDANFVIWKKYGATGWPHLVVLDPDGRIVGETGGEGQYDLLDKTIGAVAQEYAGKLNLNPLPLRLEKDKVPESLLAFPGKVLADEKSKRLFIADTHHNRIIIASLGGQITDIAGSGSIGKADGSFAEAHFHHPQGLLLDGNDLYVADTENHVVRRLDLTTRKVTTVAGTGSPGYPDKGGPGLDTPLNSPWDLTRVGPDIYIAMAGSHQIWVYHPADGQGRPSHQEATVEPFAGTGREDLKDGPAASAALAQPSGITSDGKNLYFADSEASAIRTIDRTGSRPTVKTLIGTGLFDFGDKDGPLSSAVLQHPLGVAYAPGKLFIADTYNHKIKFLNLGQGETESSGAKSEPRSITTFAGTGKPGLGNMTTPQFNEPGGLSLAGDTLYVADTNNNAIRLINLKTRQVSTLNLIPPMSASAAKVTPTFDISASAIKVKTAAPIPITGVLAVSVQLPPHYHLNAMAHPTVQFKSSRPGQAFISPISTPQVTGNILNCQVNTGMTKPKSIEAALTYYYCREDGQGQCFIGSALIEGPAAEGSGILPVIAKPRR